MRVVIILAVFLAVHLVIALPGEKVVFDTAASTLFLSDRDPTAQKRCRHSIIQSLLQVRCAELNLDKIPSYVQNNIQILDFSGNRLREINDGTLNTFTSLEYAYFTNNFILKINDEAFDHQKKLQVLDVATNGLSDIPASIFQLPKLKKLYLGENKFTDLSLEISGESNLEFIELTKNELKRIPHLQPLTQLKYLNVSHNKISNIKPEDLAIFCSLEVLDVSENPLNLESCDCQAFNEWIVFKKIRMKPERLQCSSRKCNVNLSILSNSLISNETIKLDENCHTLIEERIATVKARSLWFSIACSVLTFLVILFIVLYCIHKRNSRKKKPCKLKKELAANAELLNGVNNTSDHT